MSTSVSLDPYRASITAVVSWHSSTRVQPTDASAKGRCEPGGLSHCLEKLISGHRRLRNATGTCTGFAASYM
ncbi:MAG TPA: hypothetical protein VGK19_18800 [Capsulimonadaceae bacterium]